MFCNRRLSLNTPRLSLQVAPTNIDFGCQGPGCECVFLQFVVGAAVSLCAAVW